MLSLMMSMALAADMATAPATVEIQEWQVPWEQSRPRDPYVGDQDEIWFVGQRSDYAAVLNPKTGEFKRVDLPEGAGPHNIIVDERGAWYAGNKGAHIGLIDREDYSIEQFTLPGNGRRDVHTMQFDSEDNIWFTAQGANQLGYFDTATESFKIWDIPTKRARPYGLIMVDDQPWATLFGSNKLVTIVDGELKEINLPRPQMNRPRRLAATADGHFWYGDYAGGFLGRYNPETEQVTEWPMPAGVRSMPYAVAADDQGYVWLAETGVQPNRIVGFNTKTETFTDPVAVPSGGGTVRHMVFDPVTNSLWFGTDTNTIGQARISYGEN